MTDSIQVASEEQIRQAASATMKPKVLAEARYRWLITDQRDLPVNPEKPRTKILDVTPLADPNDAASAKFEFTQEVWLRLPAVGGVELSPDERKETLNFLRAVFPDRIESFVKNGTTYTFRGEAVVGDAAFNVAQTEQWIQVMTLSQEILTGETSLSDGVFYALAKHGKNGGRVFVNYPSAELKAGTEAGVPRAA